MRDYHTDDAFDANFRAGAAVDAPGWSDGVRGDGGDRPDDCQCSGGRLEEIPCFHCVQAGYTDPNPEVSG